MCYIVFSFKKITLVYFDCILTSILPVNVTWMSSLRHFFVPQRIFSHIFNTKVVVCVAHEGDGEGEKIHSLCTPKYTPAQMLV